MSSWLVFVTVGLGSFLMRVVPLVARSGTAMSPRLERSVHHGGTAAVTALVVTTTAGAGQGPTPLVAVVAAVVAGLVLAMKGRSMLFVVVFGTGVAAGATLFVMLISHAGGSS
jgi:branched-subunit amino acid transport protein